MFGQHLHSLTLVWRQSLVGGAMVVAGAAVGWSIGRARRNRLVRAVAWWLHHVVHPLMASRTWFRRTVIIAANNSLICAAVVVLGSLGHVAWLGVAGIGLGLGIALRLMIAEPIPEQDDQPPVGGSRVLEGVGLALNALEVPAVMLAAGLGLGQGAISSTLNPANALAAFALFVLPMLLVSAAGEALWITGSPHLPSLRAPL